jgi:biopolymer transport protein TolR
MAFSTQGHGKAGGYRPSAEINVTPLVDVMLVLLIIFIITAPMLASGLKIDLPQAKAAQNLNPKESIVLTIARDGRLMIGNEDVARTELAATIRSKSGGEPRIVHLRGDRDVAYGDIIAVIDHLAANGIVKVALMASSRSKPAPDGPVRPQ